MVFLLILEADQRMFEPRASPELRLVLRARRAAFGPEQTLRTVCSESGKARVGPVIH
jgi:hypothetical protein